MFVVRTFKMIWSTFMGMLVLSHTHARTKMPTDNKLSFSITIYIPFRRNSSFITCNWSFCSARHRSYQTQIFGMALATPSKLLLIIFYDLRRKKQQLWCSSKWGESAPLTNMCCFQWRSRKKSEWIFNCRIWAPAQLDIISSKKPMFMIFRKTLHILFTPSQKILRTPVALFFSVSTSRFWQIC